MSGAAVIVELVATPGQQLSERDQAILDFENGRWEYACAKESAISQKFGMSATRYYQVLNHLLDLPAALAYSPVLAERLRRLREARRRPQSRPSGT